MRCSEFNQVLGLLLQIKVNNQYDLNEGERSVFDAELAGLKGPLAKATPAWVPKPHKPDGPPKPARWRPTLARYPVHLVLSESHSISSIAPTLTQHRAVQGRH